MSRARRQDSQRTMISVVQLNDARYVITDGDERLGWIDGRTIGFRGFTSELDCRGALIQAYRAIDRSVPDSRQSWAWRDAVNAELRLVRDGAVERYEHAKTVVARLLRPHGRAFDTSFGVEIELPASAGASHLLQVAHAMAIAVVPWRDRGSRMADRGLGLGETGASP